MHAAPLPCGAEDAGDGGLQPLMSIGDHQLDAGEAPAHQSARRKLVQNGSASEGPMCRPTISLFPSVLTATAIIAATDTMRPPSRTFR